MLTRTGETIKPIILAHVAPFWLGDIEVHPATRQLIRNSAHETIEPRVMQVLVALAQADSRVVTRDELTDLCWDGRIVSENAINRVISRIRQIAADFACNSFELETITKVGYRIVATAAGGNCASAGAAKVSEQASLETDRDASGRRRFILGSLATALLAGGSGFYIWNRSRRHEPSPEAQELFRRGTVAQRQGNPDQVRQAVSFFEQAVSADPRYAEAWGALALSYRHILEGFAASEQRSLPDRIRSAAQRALALDPNNGDAQLALAIVKPFYRNWRPMEEDLRRVVREHPDHWLAQAQLGLLLQDVGRVNEGILHSQRVLEIDPYLPVGNAFLIRALSIARRLQEADALSRRALERWPSHPMVWNVRFNVLLFSNRAGSAAAFVSDPEHQPELLQPSAVAMRLTLARAVEERRSADIEASVEAYRRLALDDVQSLPIAAAFLALLGRPDLCFSALERYYFGTGSFGPPIPPPGRYDRRFGIALFAPPITELRQDPRYQSLLDRTGLTDYWRQTHTIPDFRRA